jgi:hypothetical protein
MTQVHGRNWKLHAGDGAVLVFRRIFALEDAIHLEVHSLFTG